MSLKTIQALGRISNDLHDLHPGLSSADIESILMPHEAKRSKQLRVEQAVLCSAVMLLGVCRNSTPNLQSGDAHVRPASNFETQLTAPCHSAFGEILSWLREAHTNFGVEAAAK